MDIVDFSDYIYLQYYMENVGLSVGSPVILGGLYLAAQS